MEDGEGESGVKHHASQSGHHARVEAHSTTACVDAVGDCHEAFASGVLLLHFGLDNVDWVVSHHRAETSETACKQINDDLVVHVVVKELFGVGEDHKSDGLIRRLLQNGGDNTSIETSDTSLGRDSIDTLENVLVLRSWGELVVDELGLEGFLGCDDHYSLGETGGQTAAEGVALGVTGEHVFLGVFEGTKSDGVLGH